MHVYAMGSGEKIVVLLPGFGALLPSVDFGPLMRALSDTVHSKNRESRRKIWRWSVQKPEDIRKFNDCYTLAPFSQALFYFV